MKLFLLMHFLHILLLHFNETIFTYAFRWNYFYLCISFQNKCDATYSGQGMTLCMCSGNHCNADPGIRDRLELLAVSTDQHQSPSSNQNAIIEANTSNLTIFSTETSTTTATKIMGVTIEIQTSAPSVAVAVVAASNPPKNLSPTLIHTYATTILTIFCFNLFFWLFLWNQSDYLKILLYSKNPAPVNQNTWYFLDSLQ